MCLTPAKEGGLRYSVREGLEGKRLCNPQNCMASFGGRFYVQLQLPSSQYAGFGLRLPGGSSWMGASLTAWAICSLRAAALTM